MQECGRIKRKNGDAEMFISQLSHVTFEDFIIFLTSCNDDLPYITHHFVSIDVFLNFFVNLIPFNIRFNSFLVALYVFKKKKVDAI